MGGGGFINVTDGADVASPLYPYVTGQSYTARIYDTGAGFLHYLRPSNVAAWTLIWERTTSVPHLTTLWPNVNNHSIQGATDFIRVRDGLVKPPIAFQALPAIDYQLVGAADGIFECAIKAPVNDQRSLYFRQSDPTHYWRLEMDTASNTMRLLKNQGAGEITVALTSVLWSPGTSYLCRAALLRQPHPALLRPQLRALDRRQLQPERRHLRHRPDRRRRPRRQRRHPQPQMPNRRGDASVLAISH